MEIICSGTCPVDPADLHHDAWMVSRNVFKITLLFRTFCISNTLLNWNWVNIATVFSQNNPLSTQDVNPLERTCTLYRNHSDGIYRVGHTTLILYHILELARALTSHYFFTVSGKDLNGTLKTGWPWLYQIITIADSASAEYCSTFTCVSLCLCVTDVTSHLFTFITCIRPCKPYIHWPFDYHLVTTGWQQRKDS